MLKVFVNLVEHIALFLTSDIVPLARGSDIVELNQVCSNETRLEDLLSSLLFGQLTICVWWKGIIVSKLWFVGLPV